jgi:hypothetical protein
MVETNSPSLAHVGYDISPLKRVKFKILTTSLIAWPLVVKILNLTLLRGEIS